MSICLFVIVSAQEVEWFHVCRLCVRISLFSESWIDFQNNTVPGPSEMFSHVGIDFSFQSVHQKVLVLCFILQRKKQVRTQSHGTATHSLTIPNQDFLIL